MPESGENPESIRDVRNQNQDDNNREEASVPMRSFTHTLIEKSHRYSDQPDRMTFRELVLQVKGDNSVHDVVLRDGHLTCDCDHQRHEGICAHVLAAERLFRMHLPTGAVSFPGTVVG